MVTLTLGLEQDLALVEDLAHVQGLPHIHPLKKDQLMLVEDLPGKNWTNLRQEGTEVGLLSAKD